MSSPIRSPRVAIIDYGLGNLFSVKHACEHAGIRADITSERKVILAADAVILPGVGAFGDAMDTLRRLDLVTVFAGHRGIAQAARRSLPRRTVTDDGELRIRPSSGTRYHRRAGSAL